MVDKTGKETVLHSFTGGTADGAYPIGGLLLDANGNLYGTTSKAGTTECNQHNGCGVVFMMDSTGKETVLYRFRGYYRRDGEEPYGSLVRDAKGNLYGTASEGGASDYGIVFMLDRTRKETILYSFTGTDGDGAIPEAGLVRDAAGNLYGTTVFGGYRSAFDGAGTVFKVDTTGTETVLYFFCLAYDCTDGIHPDGGLVRDAKGNLYSTTQLGGEYDDGVVFKVDKSGTETVLYTFTGGGDGWSPQAGLVRDGKGNLYGTTAYGGASGYGVVFELTP